MGHSPKRGKNAGWYALSIALVALLALSFLPTEYVIQRPGPVYDTLSAVKNADDEEVPLIEIEGAETFETAGSLSLTTVQVVGNRERTPSWFELVQAWMDSSRAVVPIDAVFPEGVTTEERDERNAVLMVDSQHEATAAALTELGMDVGAEAEIVELTEGSPAEGILQAGDVILTAAGTRIGSATELRGIIQEQEGAPVDLTVRRDGTEITASVTPELVKAEGEGEDAWLIGVSLTTSYDFPVDVTIQLDNVGGPSAGQMFALGIIDQLTPGELTGGEDIAGTGTIDAAGTIGSIGGIRQKLYGARDAGASFFLAPESNCGEVVGHIPDGLQVISTATLADSMAALEVIANGGDLASLPACEAPE